MKLMLSAKYLLERRLLPVPPPSLVLGIASIRDVAGMGLSRLDLSDIGSVLSCADADLSVSHTACTQSTVPSVISSKAPHSS